MSQEISTQLTLWKDSVYVTKGKRGRPPFQRTQENANKVSMLLAAGWSNDRIATCILDPRTGQAISTKTLKRYFSPELAERDNMRDRLKARQLMRLWLAAEEGNMTAERVFNQCLAQNDLMQVQKDLDQEIEEKKPEPMGKKQISAAAAEAAEQNLEDELNSLQKAARARFN